MQHTPLGWAPTVPNHWDIVPLRYVAKMGTGHTPDRTKPEYWHDCTIPWVTTPDVSRRGDTLAPLMNTEQKISEIGMANSAAVLHPTNTVMLSRTASVGYSVRIGRPMATTQAFVTWSAGPRLDPRYLLLVLRAMKPEWEKLAYGSTHLTIYMPDLESLRIPLPPLNEQRRIADFLDAETARIDRVVEARQAQSALLSLMLGQLIDGATAGDAKSLEEIGVDSDGVDWEIGKVSRLCQVIPGYAFPSEGFLHTGGTRLLRGINVSVDETSWDDTVSWDEDNTPAPQRFHLRDGDLVMGMDRPWISSGMRMTFISEKDLPALLLQRVACLRPKSAEVNMRYVYWSLRSSRFRQAVEGELTGVSVPHLSGDQIGGFTFPLPPLSTQRDISDRLSAHSARIRSLRSTMNRQAELLDERRQALITAAVTGQFDVTTASGRNVTEGVAV
ncbi:restriction endonuclease subunit S [Streptomyces olivaceoviridis]|uniref:restriction endonuclease subunit S n=1 Tax=Streptomyces olivaceoviridis TaxID=1921 RepID=UPI0036CDCCBC